MIITETPRYFEIAFNYNPKIKEEVKSIPGSRWNPLTKNWTVPVHSRGHVNRLKAKYTNDAAFKTEIIGDIDPLPQLKISIPLRREPFPYQNNGIAYALEKRKCIFGDQPGLGKTGQAIAASMGAQAKCILVICPATLRENWKREWKIWTDKNALVLTDKIKSSWVQYYKVGMCNVFICNYESLEKYFVNEIIKTYDEKSNQQPLRLNHIKFKDCISLFDTVIIDECHRVRNGKTKQAKCVMGITKGKQNIFALTGTPVVNKPNDLIPQLHIIEQLHVFGGYKGFVDRYCQGPSESSNLKELNYLMHKHCFFRREKKDVLKDLPDKLRSIITCDITNQSEYQFAENNFREFLQRSGFSSGQVDRSLRAEVLVQMMTLKKLSARGKIEEVKEHIQEVIDAGEKIVLFAHHKEIVLELKKHIPCSVTVVGDDTMDERQRSVDSFQNDPKVQVIICNIKSGGVGITLTASSRVVFIELPWHAADCDQAEDRCHRIGQKDSVQATYFIGHNTIDNYIYSIIERKRGIANQVTGAKEEIETNMVDEFLNLFMKEKV